MDQTVDLGSITRAYDRTRYLGSAEYPGKGRLSCRPAMTRTHLLESFSEGKIQDCFDANPLGEGFQDAPATLLP